jgi:hypothetical protein
VWRGTDSKTTKRGAEQGAGVPCAAVAVKGLRFASMNAQRSRALDRHPRYGCFPGMRRIPSSHVRNMREQLRRAKSVSGSSGAVSRPRIPFPCCLQRKDGASVRRAWRPVSIRAWSGVCSVGVRRRTAGDLIRNPYRQNQRSSCGEAPKSPRNLGYRYRCRSGASHEFSSVCYSSQE